MITLKYEDTFKTKAGLGSVAALLLSAWTCDMSGGLVITNFHGHVAADLI